MPCYYRSNANRKGSEDDDNINEDNGNNDDFEEESLTGHIEEQNDNWDEMLDNMTTEDIHSFSSHSCVRIHRKGNHIILAACDASILEAHLKHNSTDVVLSREFYLEMIVPFEEIPRLLSITTSANLFGKGTVEAAISAGIVDRGSVMYIDGVPHVQVFYI